MKMFQFFKKSIKFTILLFLVFFFMFLIFGPEACGSQLPDEGRNRSTALGSEVLTTGPPVKTF